MLCQCGTWVSLLLYTSRETEPTSKREGHKKSLTSSVDASKSIIFATKNHLGQNFGVVLGWMISWMIILSITVIFQRRKTEKNNMKAKWEEMKTRDVEKRGLRRSQNDDE